MPLDLVTVPCLKDNYAFLVHNTATGATALVDAPEAEPIMAALTERGWSLTDIILTHHHWDHVDGLEPLRAAFAPRVIGAAADAHRLPALDLAVKDGDSFDLLGQAARVMDVSGHTLGHIAVHLPEAQLVFTADSLMALGCGRLFEGTPAQMWQSLSNLSALPDQTVVCSGHEYTASNARFALTIDPDNPDLIARAARIDAARAANQPTVPSTMLEERQTNPFLRPHDPQIRARLGMIDATDAEVFAEIRARKDRF
jgi:hydroxyacylglutathione hydrolase